jgi:DNA-damage-inducible protein D
MSIDEDSNPASQETARAALENIRRMLKGEVPFPTSLEAAAEMVKAAKPVKAQEPIDPPFNGTSEEVIAGFEAAVKMTADDVEYWSARELMKLLGYRDWKEFESVIQRAYMACNQSGLTINDHFAEVSQVKEYGSFTKQDAIDINVTRYGAYLIAQNGDTKKKQVAFAQTYFAVQTRQRELESAREEQLAEQQRRIALRDKIAEHNKDLAEAAKDAGVVQPIDYAAFQNAGYRGLYNGLDVAGIRTAKALSSSSKILDHMGSTELAANLFRATQAEEKLRREGIKGKFNANNAHYEVGRKVRKAIADIGGTMPEKLDPAEDINKIRQRLENAEPTKRIK